VPNGFAVPFSFYDRFMRHNGLYAQAKSIRAAARFKNDTKLRMKALEAFRARIVSGKWPSGMRDAIGRRFNAHPSTQTAPCYPQPGVSDWNHLGNQLRDCGTVRYITWLECLSFTLK